MLGERNTYCIFTTHKRVIIIRNEIAQPIAVASPAPNIPIFIGNTKIKSPRMLNNPPLNTAIVANPGFPSFLKMQL